MVGVQGSNATNTSTDTVTVSNSTTRTPRTKVEFRIAGLAESPKQRLNVFIAHCVEAELFQSHLDGGSERNEGVGEKIEKV